MQYNTQPYQDSVTRIPEIQCAHTFTHQSTSHQPNEGHVTYSPEQITSSSNAQRTNTALGHLSEEQQPDKERPTTAALPNPATVPNQHQGSDNANTALFPSEPATPLPQPKPDQGPADPTVPESSKQEAVSRTAAAPMVIQNQKVASFKHLL